MIIPCVFNCFCKHTNTRTKIKGDVTYRVFGVCKWYVRTYVVPFSFPSNKCFLIVILFVIYIAFKFNLFSGKVAVVAGDNHDGREKSGKSSRLLSKLFSGSASSVTVQGSASMADEITLRTFTLKELLMYDGKTAKTDYKIYFAVLGKVFDVSRGANFYGPSGPYGCFAGRDATVGLSRNDLKAFEGMKPGEIQPDPRPLIEKFTKEERQSVQEWVIISKYY